LLSDMSRVVEDSARGGFYLTLGNITSTIIQGISVFIIARILGSEQYGLYTISTVIPALFLLFVNPGIDQGITKYSASLRTKGKKDRIAKLLAHGLLFKTTLATAALAICLIFADQFSIYMNRPGITDYLQLASIVIIFQAIYTTIGAAFVGVDRTEYSALTATIQAVVKAVAAPALVIIGLSIAGALMGSVLSFLVASLLGICFLIVKVYRPLNHSNLSTEPFSNNLRMLIRYGLPLYASALIYGFTQQYQYILLSIFTTDYEIGNFKAATNFGILVSSLTIPIATVLLPAFSKLESKNQDIREFLGMAIKYTSMAIIPLATILILDAPGIVQIMYGEGYDWELAPAFLSTYAIQFLMVGLGSIVLGSLFSGLGETKINLKIALVHAVTIIILAPIFTSFLRIYGMITAIIVALIISTSYALYTARSKYKIGLNIGTTAKIYIAAIISAVPILALQKILPTPTLLQVMLGTAIYLTTYLILIPTTKIITQPELNQIKTVIDKIQPLKYLAHPIFYFAEKILSKMP